MKKIEKYSMRRVIAYSLTLLTCLMAFSACKNVREVVADAGLRVELTDVKRYGDAKEIENLRENIDRGGRKWVEYQDELVSFNFAKENFFKHYYFEIENESSSEIQIDWSEASFIDEDGNVDDILIDGVQTSKYKEDRAFKEEINVKYEGGKEVEHAIVPFGQFVQSSSARKVWIACVGKSYGDKLPLGPERERLSKEERDSPFPVSEGKCSFLYTGGIDGRRQLAYGTYGTENIEGVEYSIQIPVRYGQKTAQYEFKFEVSKVLV